MVALLSIPLPKTRPLSSKDIPVTLPLEGYIWYSQAPIYEYNWPVLLVSGNSDFDVCLYAQLHGVMINGSGWIASRNMDAFGKKFSWSLALCGTKLVPNFDMTARNVEVVNYLPTALISVELILSKISTHLDLNIKDS